MSQKYRNNLQTRLEVETQENETQDTPRKSIAEAFRLPETLQVFKEYSKTQSSSLIMQELSLKQKKQKVGKESNQNKEQRRELNKERNKTLKQPKKELWNDNNNQVDSELQDIEK